MLHGLTDRILKASRPVNRLSRSITWAIGGIAILQGLLIIWGGPGRWVGPGYTTVRDFPGAPFSWGLAAVLAGVLVVTGSLYSIIHSIGHWVKVAGMVLAAVWCTGFLIGTIVTVQTVPTAGTTGIGAYLGGTVVSALMIFVDETGQTE